MANVTFYRGTTVPTTDTLSDGGIYFNTSNNNIYINNSGSLITFKGTDTNNRGKIAVGSAASSGNSAQTNGNVCLNYYDGYVSYAKIVGTKGVTVTCDDNKVITVDYTPGSAVTSSLSLVGLNTTSNSMYCASGITTLSGYMFIQNNLAAYIRYKDVSGSVFGGFTTGSAYTSSVTVTDIPGIFLYFDCLSVSGWKLPTRKGASWGSTSSGGNPSIKLNGQWTALAKTHTADEHGSFRYYYIPYAMGN